MVRATQVPRILRSAGARAVGASEVYKHLVPSEPEHHSVSVDICYGPLAGPACFQSVFIRTAFSEGVSSTLRSNPDT